MSDRIIRDEVWLSDRFLDLPTDAARLSFFRFISLADDFGNFEGGLKRLFRLLHACTQLKTEESAAHAIDALMACDLIRRYEVEGRELFHIPRFHVHKQYLARRFPYSPWCDPDTQLGKTARGKNVVNQGLAKNSATTSTPRSNYVVTTSQLRSNDVAVGEGVGVAVGVAEGVGVGEKTSNLKVARTQAQLDCPHFEVLELWAEVLPSLPRHDPEQWRGVRADHLRSRWRETATLKKWPDANAGLTYFRKLFTYVGQSEFLTGKSKSRDGKRPFVIELEWLVKPINWAKVIEGKYHAEVTA